MENPTHALRETNFALKLILESRIESNVAMSWRWWKKNKCILCNIYFDREIFFNIFFLSQCILDWINFQNIYTLTYRNTLLHTLFRWFLKSSKTAGRPIRKYLKNHKIVWGHLPSWKETMNIFLKDFVKKDISFLVLSNFPWFLYFGTNILFSIVNKSSDYR